MRRNLVLLLGLSAVVVIGVGCDKLKSRDNLNRGVQAFKNSRFPEAVDYFQKAVQLEPTNTNTHFYLAIAYMSQYIPGADSPENNHMADNAFKEFQEVLKIEPKDANATAYIASLYYNQKKMEQASEWYRKVIALDPKNKEAFYTLGVIAWANWLVPDREARNKMSMRPEDPGPLKDKKVKAELKAKYKPSLDEGVDDLKKALEIDPEYDDAMAYMNLLIRYRADLDDTPEEYKKDTEEADGWVQKTLATKKIKNERHPQAGGITNDVLK